MTLLDLVDCRSGVKKASDMWRGNIGSVGEITKHSFKERDRKLIKGKSILILTHFRAIIRTSCEFKTKFNTYNHTIKSQLS